jgi:hypothetical protein
MKKNLTILAGDTMFHKLTRKSLEKTIEVTGVENVLVFSDQDILPGSRWIKTEPMTRWTYSELVFNKLHEYVETDHVMIVQYDGLAVDKNLWRDEFLNYDYIGSPWPWLPADKNVGNGGFSIRSRKLIEACKDLVFNPFNHEDGDHLAEDFLICLLYREVLESKGIAFSPSWLANLFSMEMIPGRFNTFGFHGNSCLPYYLDDDACSKDDDICKFKTV